MTQPGSQSPWPKLLAVLKFVALTVASGILCTAYFAVPQNTENFWSGVTSATSAISTFAVGFTQWAQQRSAPKPAVAVENAPVVAESTPVDSDQAVPAEQIAPETVDGPDCSFSPPEPSEKTMVMLPPFMEPPLPPRDPGAAKKRLKQRRLQHGKPLRFEKTKVHGIPLYKTVIDLDDPETYITIGLANNAHEANSNLVTHGDETFDSFLKRCKGAFLANGTFFSKDGEKRVMGNMVVEGEFRKYSQWEDYGTTLGIKQDNELEMVTARLEGKPCWNNYWFSVTCGPRLLTRGEVTINATDEGFRDSHVLTVGPRAAIGFNHKKRQLIHAAFLRGLSLEQEAKLMKALGCDEAMNLDGGASRALAHQGSVIVKAGRPLTNVLIVYDATRKAPPNVVASWERFQEGERPALP